MASRNNQIATPALELPTTLAFLSQDRFELPGMTGSSLASILRSQAAMPQAELVCVIFGVLAKRAGRLAESFALLYRYVKLAELWRDAAPSLDAFIGGLDDSSFIQQAQVSLALCARNVGFGVGL